MVQTKGRARDPETRLREDIRLLGRILGDVLKRHEGTALFDVIEEIRQTATRFRREGKSVDARALDLQLKRLSRDATISVVRAFSYFSHLANLAEDQQQVRTQRQFRRRGQAAPGGLAETFARLAQHKIEPERVQQLLAQACVMPVLTAHPTEVQRKSILDTERAIAGLLDQLDQTGHTAESGAVSDAGDAPQLLFALISTLWQTRMLRPQKLTVSDEIANALSYWRTTFIPQLPRLYLDLARQLNRADVAPFLRLGSWIGGDRDGHPNVDADTMRAALAAQAATVFEFYLGEVHALGAELSISALLAPPSAQLAALAQARCLGKRCTLRSGGGLCARPASGDRFAGSAGKRASCRIAPGAAATRAFGVRLLRRYARPAPELGCFRSRGGGDPRRRGGLSRLSAPCRR